MTSPDYPGKPLPAKTWSPTTVYQAQQIDPDDYALSENAETHGQAEAVRSVFFSSIYTEVQKIPIIGGLIGDIIEIFTGVEDGDLSDLGSWVNNLGSLINNFIASALHALADLLDFIPIIGPGLSNVIEGIANGMNGTHATAVAAETLAGTANSVAETAIINAGTAVSAASAAANAAANAGEKADFAYAAATEWAREFVVSSAEVTVGAGEILVGPMLPVRAGRIAIMTDVSVALLEQVGGLTAETRIWNPAGTAYVVAHTGVIDPAVTRRTFSGLSHEVVDEERFFPYVADIVGTIPPTVLQIAVSGVYIDEELLP